MNGNRMTSLEKLKYDVVIFVDAVKLTKSSTLLLSINQTILMNRKQDSVVAKRLTVRNIVDINDPLSLEKF